MHGLLGSAGGGGRKGEEDVHTLQDLCSTELLPERREWGEGEKGERQRKGEGGRVGGPYLARPPWLCSVPAGPG